MLVTAGVVIGLSTPAQATVPRQAAAAASAPVTVSVSAGLVCSTFDGTEATAASVTASVTGLDPNALYAVFVTPNGGPDDVALGNEPSATDADGDLDLTEIEYADTWLPDIATSWVVQNAQDGSTAASGTLTVTGCTATAPVTATLTGAVVCSTYNGTSATALAETAVATGLTPNAQYDAAVLPNGGAGDTALNADPVTADSNGDLDVSMTRYADSWVAGVGANWVIQDVSSGAVAITGTLTVAGCPLQVPVPRAAGLFGATALTVDGGGQVVAPGGTTKITVDGVGGVPASGVSAVLLNVTTSAATASGAVWSSPGNAALRFGPAGPSTGLVLARVDASGRVALTNHSSGSTRFDTAVAGYYLAGRATRAGSFTPIAVHPVLNTRTAAGGTVTTNVSGVPAGAGAVLLDVSVSSAQRSGAVTAWATGSPRPKTSNLSFTAGRSVTQLVLAPLSASGKVSLANGSSGTAQLSATVLGFYRAGTPTTTGALRTVPARRVLDTRVAGSDPVPPLGTVSFKVTGLDGVPTSGVSAVVLNLTTPAPAESSTLTAFASHTDQPTVASLTLTGGGPGSGLVVVPVGADGTITIASNSDDSVTLVADLEGYVRS